MSIGLQQVTEKLNTARRQKLELLGFQHEPPAVKSGTNLRMTSSIPLRLKPSRHSINKSAKRINPELLPNLIYFATRSKIQIGSLIPIDCQRLIYSRDWGQKCR